MVRPRNGKPRGLLGVRAMEPMGYHRYWPSEDLAPFVEHYWIIEWDVPAPVTRQVLSHPAVHIALEAGRSRVHGVITKTFTRHIEGTGRVVGTKFRPGGFRPFLREDVSTLTDRQLPLAGVFDDDLDLEARVLAHADHYEAIAVMETFLREREPQPDDNVARVAAIVERTSADREITRVEQLVDRFAMGKRNLQRLFGAYVGVSPKWVIQRYRLHEAADRAASGTPIDWAALAHDLGYADQAHFIRDFKRLVGRTPAEYGKLLSS